MSEAAKLRSSTPEFKSRMSELHSGKVIPQEVITKRTETLKRTLALRGNSQIGKKLSEETIAKMIESRRGYTHSKETRHKISQALKQSFKHRDQTEDKNPFFGKHHSEETKEYLRQQFTGRVFVNNGEVCRQIPSEAVSDYLQRGFRRGMLPHHKEARCWINKEGSTRLVPKSDVAKFIADGWKRGRK